MESNKVDDFSFEFEVEDVPTAVKTSEERETDPHRLAQRQKQIDFGKNSIGYQRYLQAVPKASRGRKHPQTPDVAQKTSKRAFEGQVKKWRRMLHEWDLPDETDTQAAPVASTEPLSKNGPPQRQAKGLPLKIPSAIRPATKRSRSFLDALISPTGAPPEPKQHKSAADPAAHVPDTHPSNVLMAKWRQMAATDAPQNQSDAGTGTGTDEADIEEEVSYSEDEGDEIAPMQVEPAHISA